MRIDGSHPLAPVLEVYCNETNITDCRIVSADPARERAWACDGRVFRGDIRFGVKPCFLPRLGLVARFPEVHDFLIEDLCSK
jgi:hypothetical protein